MLAVSPSPPLPAVPPTPTPASSSCVPSTECHTCLSFFMAGFSVPILKLIFKVACKVTGFIMAFSYTSYHTLSFLTLLVSTCSLDMIMDFIMAYTTSWQFSRMVLYLPASVVQSSDHVIMFKSQPSEHSTVGYSSVFCSWRSLYFMFSEKILSMLLRWRWPGTWP